MADDFDDKVAAGRLRLVLKSHTVCRDGDGVVQWEADTVPVEVEVGLAAALQAEGSVFRIDTVAIRTGRERF